MYNKTIPIIIPAYEPDEKLIKLLGELKNADLNPVILVDTVLFLLSFVIQREFVYK